jgi:hypothetical protein
MNHTPDQKYMDYLKDVTYNPVFILGLHRSGTTILYTMLGKTQQVNIVTAYHILSFDKLLTNYFDHKEESARNKLAQLFQSKGITNRRIDKVIITPEFSQEYGYLFLNKGYPPRLTEKTQKLFDLLCKKIQYIAQNHYPILLKNPYDFPNFVNIKNRYPQAKFVFIHRNPEQVISSTLRAWQTLLKEQNPYTSLFSYRYANIFENPLLLWLTRWFYGSRFPLGLLNIVRYSAKATRWYLDNIGKLSMDDYIAIRYEDLCQEPNNIMSEVLDFLGLEISLDFKDFIKPRGLNVLPAVRRFQPWIFRSMKEYYQTFQY